MSIPKPELPKPDTAVPPRRNPFGRRDAQPAPDSSTAEEPQRRGSRGHMADSVAKVTRRPGRPADTVDILLSVPTDLAERLESVLAYTYPHTGVKTKQQFVRAAIAQACAEHEERFNSGERWPAIPKPGAE